MIRMTKKVIGASVSKCQKNPARFEVQEEHAIGDPRIYHALCGGQGDGWRDCHCLGDQSLSESVIERRVEVANDFVTKRPTSETANAD